AISGGPVLVTVAALGDQAVGRRARGWCSPRGGAPAPPGTLRRADRPGRLVGHGSHHRPRPPDLALHSPPGECTADGRDGPAGGAGGHPAGPVPVGPGAKPFDIEAAPTRGVLRSPRCPG